ncbi:S8 family serine peptidase [Arthrobacter sp. NPDC093125]|uniref:S8 family serine peptidase n=1 Tax=Arthrobacter sp. NPDC093125 TaxID=3363944 RepID=UPI0037FA8683
MKDPQIRSSSLRPALATLLLTAFAATSAGTAATAAPATLESPAKESPKQESPAAETPTATRQPGAARYLVRYAAGTDVAAKARTLRARNVAVGRTFSKALRGAVVTATPAQLADLQRSPDVAAVEIDAPVTISETQQPAPWGLDRTDQRTLPLSGSYTSATAGAGVTAYVVDTGVLASHADFGGRVAAGWATVTDGLDTGDCNGHGTHVAGIIAGKTYGMAKAATVVPVRALDCNGAGYNSQVVAGLEWIVSHHQAGTPAVANLSLGSTPSAMVDAAVKGVIADGVSVAVSAGNSAVDACNSSPARVPEALTVAASDSSDRQASFSNFGTCVDLYAPGVGIASAGISSTTAKATMSGTSMASPHVAGAAALLLSANPALSPADVSAKLLARTSTDVIAAPGPGTPNRLLNTEAAAPAPAPAPVSEEPVSQLPVAQEPAPAPAASGPSIRSGADIVAAAPDGVLWNYPANGKGGFQTREKIGTGWSSLAKGFVTDWNTDGVFDVIAQWKDGRLSLYAGKPGGGLAAAKAIGSGWGSYHVTVGRWRTADKYPGILAYDAAGTLWYYGNSTGSTLASRTKAGTGWGGLYLTMVDFDQDGKQDLLAKRSDGGLVLYRSTGTGAFVAESRRVVGTGWNTINSITGVGGFTIGSHGLMSRLGDGRLAHYPYSRGTWGARTIVGSGWGSFNIFR